MRCNARLPAKHILTKLDLRSNINGVERDRNKANEKPPGRVGRKWSPRPPRAVASKSGASTTRLPILVFATQHFCAGAQTAAFAQLDKEPLIYMFWKTIFLFISIVVSTSSVQAQSITYDTYHLHKEASSTSGLDQLKTTGPDANSLGLQSGELKDQAPGEYVIKAFDTQASVPNESGVIPAGSTVSFALWMKKTANFGTMYPRVKLYLNSPTGTSLCSVTGSGALGTILTQSPITCSVPSTVSMSATDRIYLWVGVSLTVGPGANRVKAELDVETNTDSTIMAPRPFPPPAISTLTPTSGPAGTSVTIAGSNFGSTQVSGNTKVIFNGVTSSPYSWSDTSIVAPVPPNLATGPVVVSVRGAVSNGVTFTVNTGTIAGSITRVTGGTAVSGALVGALQSGLVKASANSGPSGGYSIAGLAPGTYDIGVSASGYVSEGVTGISVSAGTTTTANVALYQPSTIGGKVTKSDGVTAIEGSTLKVLQGTDAKGTATTNSAGNYTVTGLRPGTYQVEAAATTYQTSNQAGITTAEAATTTVNFSLNAITASIVTYLYDDVGRLLGASDPATDTASYSYDSVGNLQSIARQNSSLVSIIEITPNKGLVGASITIYGTAFSTTPSQNTVLFNSVAATVTSATATQVATSVPTGATTGPISITTPTGSATSGVPFTVASPPTVTSFTPTIATPGTALIINGANFDSTAANNDLLFNITRAIVSSATPAVISTSVPVGATSGHISVTTPYGNSVTTGDLFVPPSPYMATDVVVTGRMAIGDTRTITTSTAGKIGLMLFDGTAGQQLTIHLTNNTMGSVTVTSYQVDGSSISTTGSAASFNLASQTLSKSGTCTISIAPTSPNIGSLNVNVTSP
jgi:YD repeat-containing protein